MDTVSELVSRAGLRVATATPSGTLLGVMVLVAILVALATLVAVSGDLLAPESESLRMAPGRWYA